MLAAPPRPERGMRQELAGSECLGVCSMRLRQGMDQTMPKRSVAAAGACLNRSLSLEVAFCGG